MSEVRVGVIGGGLMGRELAATLGRWATFSDHGATPVLRGVCDTNPQALEWFRRVGTVRNMTTDYRYLLDDPDIDVLYVAVPHHLHQQIFIDVIQAGKDFLGEKPFGMDLEASRAILAALRDNPKVFARVSSEMVFFPGAQEAYRLIREGALGDLLDVSVGLEHSSDLNRHKPINWKRQAEFCGPGGVMADLGMHALHIPLRLGWRPSRMFAVLSDVVTERPAPGGGVVRCDTIDNASILAQIGDSQPSFPLSISMKRIAPGQSNTWRIFAAGMEGGVDFTTRSPSTLRTFRMQDGRQQWCEEMTGSVSVFGTHIPPLTEFGFSDAILQMWAAFLSEREGKLGERFGCATPDEAVRSHELFTAALASQSERVGASPRLENVR